MKKIHPCASCKPKNHCCIDKTKDETLLSVDFREIRKICDFTGKKPSDFAHFKRLSDKRYEELDEEEKYYFIDKSMLIIKKKNNRCIFLDKNNRCIIHHIRPSLCRLFPFWYEIDNRKFRITRHNKREYDTCYITKKAPRICNKLFSALGTSKQELIKAAKECEKGLEEYQKYRKYLLKESIEDVMKRMQLKH